MIKKSEWIALILMPLVFTVFSIFLKAPFFVMIILFFGIPSFYFSLKKKEYVRSTLVFTLLLLPVMMIIDYMTALNGTWTVAPSLIPYKLFGISSIENILWGFLRVYSVIQFYRILTKDKVRGFRSGAYVMLTSIGLFLLFFLVLTYYPAVLHQKNLYMLIGILCGVLPVSYFVVTQRKKISNLFIPSLYFFYFCLFFEFTGIYLHNWAFTGKDYLATFTFYNLTLPLEEVIWLLCGSAVIIIYFELLRSL